MKTDKKEFFVEERRGHILEILSQQQRVEVSDLAAQFQVSEDTIRRDLRCLHDQGLVKKTYGGAIRKHIALLDPYNIRLEQSRDIKMAIGRRAAELVEENDSLIVDSSTTTLWLVQALKVKHCRILTNDLEIAQYVAKQTSYELIVLGGRWDAQNHELLGPSLMEQVARYRVDKLILGVTALHPKHGMTGVSEEDAEAKRRMMESADRIIALADHTKVGEVSFAWIADASVIDVLVTDEQARCEEFPDLGWKIIRVPAGG